MSEAIMMNPPKDLDSVQIKRNMITEKILESTYPEEPSGITSFERDALWSVKFDNSPEYKMTERATYGSPNGIPLSVIICATGMITGLNGTVAQEIYRGYFLTTIGSLIFVLGLFVFALSFVKINRMFDARNVLYRLNEANWTVYCKKIISKVRQASYLLSPELSAFEQLLIQNPTVKLPQNDTIELIRLFKAVEINMKIPSNGKLLEFSGNNKELLS